MNCLPLNIRNRKPATLTRLWIASMAFILAPSLLHAGAWTQPAKHGQIILTSSLFRTATTFDGDGNPMWFGYDGRFQQITFNPYIEYGLTPRNTLIVNAGVPMLDFTNRYSSESSAGMGDVELGLKRRVNAVESPWALSGQIIVPRPRVPGQSQSGAGQSQHRPGGTRDGGSRPNVGKTPRLLGC